MTVDDQLKSWLAGNSIHNSERHECCPDFSCCHPELLASLEERTDFVNAHHNKAHSKKAEMLGLFLNRMLTAISPIEVYVAHERRTKK